MTLSHDEIVSTLKNVVMFAELSQDVLTDMAQLVNVVEAKSAETIIREGEVGDCLYIVASGRVQLDANQWTLSEFGPYNVFGEMAILQSSLRSASVKAVEDTVLLQLDRQPFLDLVHNRAEVMLGVIAEYGNRLRAYMRDLSSLHEQLETVILPLGISLSTEEDPRQLVERSLIEAMRLCSADFGVVYLKLDEERLEYVVFRIQSLDLALGGASGRAIPYEALSSHEEVNDKPDLLDVSLNVLRDGNTVNVADVYADARWGFGEIKARDMELDYQSRSSLTVALKDQNGKAIGVLQLVNAQDPDTDKVIRFGPVQQLVVESLASQTAVALNTQALLNRQQEFVKLESDLHVARRIQAGFLPNTLPEADGWEIAASFEPAREVAGDFYDAFMMTQNRRIGFVIADVVDKGVPAALFMALVRSLTRAFAQQNYSLDWTSMLDEGSKGSFDRSSRRSVPSAGTMSLYNAVMLTNKYILENHVEDNMFATLFFGMLDPLSGRLAYINAGHNPPFLLSPDGEIKAKLTNTGAAVGMFPNIEYKIEYTQFDPGDLLFTYTDGVTEARNADGQFLTENTLLEILSHPASSADDMLRRVQNHLQVFMKDAEQFDDITMLAVRWVP